MSDDYDYDDYDEYDAEDEEDLEALFVLGMLHDEEVRRNKSTGHPATQSPSGRTGIRWMTEALGRIAYRMR